MTPSFFSEKKEAQICYSTIQQLLLFRDKEQPIEHDERLTGDMTAEDSRSHSIYDFVLNILATGLYAQQRCGRRYHTGRRVFVCSCTVWVVPKYDKQKVCTPYANITVEAHPEDQRANMLLAQFREFPAPPPPPIHPEKYANGKYCLLRLGWTPPCARVQRTCSSRFALKSP